MGLAKGGRCCGPLLVAAFSIHLPSKPTRAWRICAQNIVGCVGIYQTAAFCNTTQGARLLGERKSLTSDGTPLCLSVCLSGLRSAESRSVYALGVIRARSSIKVRMMMGACVVVCLCEKRACAVSVSCDVGNEN